MGCVYLPHRGTSIYWMKYRGVDGKIYRESTGKDRKEDAKNELRKREGKISEGIPVTPADGRLAFDEAVAAVVNDYRVNRKRSLDNLERRIKLHLMPVFGRARMSAITTSHIRQFSAKRQADGASNAEINRELAIIKRAFNLAINDGRLHHRPHVPMLHEDNVRKGFFERDQFEAVRHHLPVALRPVVTLAYALGWRVRSEVLPLQWSQVNRQNQTIRLEPGTTKNRKGRTVPYGQHSEIVSIIEAQWTEHVVLQKKGIICPWVFHRDGSRIKDFRHAWTTATKRAGCSGRIVHDFRRTAARNLTHAGVAEKVAMAITGHKTRSTFDRYDIKTDADVADALGKLAEKTLDQTWTSAGPSGAKTGQVG